MLGGLFFCLLNCVTLGLVLTFCSALDLTKELQLTKVSEDIEIIMEKILWKNKTNFLSDCVC